MLIAERNGMMVASKLTAKSYVQDGLIAMWDGIENAGWGVHDASATVWKDLIGNCDAKTSPAQVFDDYMYEDNSGVQRTLTSPAKIDFSQMNYLTFEMCITNMVDTANWHMLIGSSTDYFSISHPYPGENRIFWKLGSGNRPLFPGRNGIVVAVYTNGSALLYRNGIAGSQVNSVKNWSNTMTLTWSCSWGQKRGTKKVHCYRLYNRALTAEEIAANYAIDKVRFKLWGGGGSKCITAVIVRIAAICKRQSSCSSHEWRVAA